ncbi:MAG: response regulator receiver [Anaerolineaceae bacterium]|nr:MAG: response regulator receiver [Anaerolineaceae bacterium]
MPSHRILIVEDQREVSRLLRTSLETLEHELEVAEIPSGEEAILDASRKKVDMLVSDYRLPGISGIELMHKVRHYHPDSKVILITGLTDPKVRKEVAEAGADAFFIKPVPIADFLDAVERGLGLVETFLPAEPISPVEAVERANLPDLLTGLRHELKATAVILLNDDGHIVARAGDLPDKNSEVALVSSLLAIHSAGQKVSRVIGQKNVSNWHVFNGGEYDLIFAPVGEAHAMLVIGKKLAEEKGVLKSVNAFSASRKTVEKVLGKPAGSVRVVKSAAEPSSTTPLEVVEKTAREMEPLFKDAKKKIKPGEADAFWTKAAGKHKSPTKPDMLSYEQAKQLGLAPEDE